MYMVDSFFYKYPLIQASYIMFTAFDTYDFQWTLVDQDGSSPFVLFILTYCDQALEI